MRRHALRSSARTIELALESKICIAKSSTQDSARPLHLVRQISQEAERDSDRLGNHGRTIAASAGAALAATLALGGFLQCTQENGAYCAAEIPLTSANPKGDHFVEEFTAWLKQRGSDLDAIELQTCKQDVVLASFPLKGAVTADTISQDQKLGEIYYELLKSGAADERQLIALFLIVERTRGPDSTWQPWISILPQSFATPLFYGKADREALKGTTLLQATDVLKDDLQRQWQELSPHVATLLRSSGTAAQGMSATFEDYLWAFTVFWSRSIAFPEPNVCPAPGSRTVKPQEGIIPGLDFCNHCPEAKARWSIWNAVNAESKVPDTIALITQRSAGWKAGDEITINYGDKSNEELLLQYGFTQDRNLHDALMLVLPRPDDEAAVAGARMQLLLLQDLRPQLFLTAAGLETLDPESQDIQKRLGLSTELWETLDILCMPPQTAVVAAETLSKLRPESGQEPRPSVRGPTAGKQMTPEEERELTKKKLAVLLKLLDSKIQEMEDEAQGTGSLENDIKLLEAADSLVSPVFRNCLVYRASQKRIARSYRAKVMEAMRSF